MAKTTVLPWAATCAHGEPEVATSLDVERGRWFVEDEQLGIGDERDRHAHSLGLSA